jgi:hypothetical protein
VLPVKTRFLLLILLICSFSVRPFKDITSVHTCFCLPLFTSVHPCSVLFTAVHYSSPVSTSVHPCSLVFNAVQYSSVLLNSVHPCSLLFTTIHYYWPCSLLAPLLFQRCSLLISPVHFCSPLLSPLHYYSLSLALFTSVHPWSLYTNIHFC